MQHQECDRNRSTHGRRHCRKERLCGERQ